MTTAFWIASGEQYLEEAMASSVSVGAYNHWPRKIFTPDDLRWHDIARYGYYQLPPRSSDDWFLDSTRYFNLILGYTQDDILVYFDTDTYCCGPLNGLVEVLTKYDIAVARAPRRRTWTNLPVPDAFSEPQIGVVAFRVNTAVRTLFKTWLDIYQSNLEGAKFNDQTTLREAMWVCADKCRTCFVSHEYNFRFQYGGLVAGKVFVLHGRSPDYIELERKTNESDLTRSWREGELV